MAGAPERGKLQLDQHSWQVVGGIRSDLAANSFGGFQLVLPTVVRAAHWFLESTHQGTQDRKPRMGSATRGEGQGEAGALQGPGKVQMLRQSRVLLRAGVLLCLCQALSA